MIRSGRFHAFAVARLVLQKLHQVVLEHDLAGCGRDVDAELERLGVGHRNPQLAVAALDVVEQVVEAAHQVLAAARHGFAEHLGIGQREIRRRERVDVLAREEVNLLLRRLDMPSTLPTCSCSHRAVIRYDCFT
jgi:hypothetical protein